MYGERFKIIELLLLSRGLEPMAHKPQRDNSEVEFLRPNRKNTLEHQSKSIFY